MTEHPHILIFIVLIPLTAALLIPAAGRIGKSLPWFITCAVTFTCFVLSVLILNRVLSAGTMSYWLGGWKPPFGIEYVVDYLNGFILAIVTFIMFLVSVYAKKSVEFEIDEHKSSFFYCIYTLFITGLIGIIITGDIFNLYVFIEIASLAGYALIAMGKKRAALMASYNYLILGTIAATFILIGIGYIYMATGTLNMADLKLRLPALYHSKVIRTAFAFFTVGLSLKLALFPLHTWLPNAYTFAPSTISALMAATGTKVGAYALLRVLFSVFTVNFNFDIVPFTKIFLILSISAIIMGSVLAVAQTNLKRMLAYSSVGQIGYIALGIALYNDTGLTGSIVHIFNHSLMKGGLFLLSGAIFYKHGIETIADLRGIGKKMPYTMAAFTAGGLSMIGVPLTVGFISKWYLVMGALKADMWYVVPVILASSLITAVYFWRIIESAYFTPAEPGTDNVTASSSIAGARHNNSEPVSEAPRGMLIPAAVLSALCVIFGIYAHVPVSIAQKTAMMLLGH